MNVVVQFGKGVQKHARSKCVLALTSCGLLHHAGLPKAHREQLSLSRLLKFLRVN